jgi:hypothetical protein
MKAMITRASFTLNCLISVLAVVPAMAAPGELYGKSVVVSWSENREESARGSSEKRQLTASQSLSVYVSSTGRLFSRREATGRFTDGMRGGRGNRGGFGAHGSNEQVGGEGRTVGGLAQQAHFAGRSLVFSQAFQSGARQVVVDFDASYGGCSARVTHGRASGQSTTAYRTLTGRDIVVYSMDVANVSCRIVNGNVFGE